MPASFVETGIIFLSSYDNRVPQMEVLKKLEKLKKLKPYALQLNIHPLKAVGFNFLRPKGSDNFFNFST